MPSAATDLPDDRKPPAATRDRYLLSLGLLLLSIVSFAAAHDRAALRTAALALQGLTLLVILWSSHARRPAFAAATTLVVVAVASSVVATLTGRIDELGTPYAMTALLALAAPLAIARRLVRQERIELSTIFAALCLYVLAGLMFASAYAAIQEFGGAPFFAQIERGRAIDFAYFSFVTLATLGYGDLTPAGDLGRMLAVTQTILGQLYLVGVVAMLVSNLGRTRSRSGPGRDRGRRPS